MAYVGEQSEWDLKLEQMGIKEPSQPKDSLQTLIDDAVSKYNPMVGRSVDEYDDMEDDQEFLEDDSVLRQYRDARLKQMKETASKQKYSGLLQISKQDFVSEVNECEKGVSVVLFMFSSGIPDCDLLEACLKTLCNRHRATKFLKIVGKECIPNYPEKNLPTILVYRDGEMVKQLIGIQSLGGKRVTPRALEIILSYCGAVTKTKWGDDDDDDDDDDSKILAANQIKVNRNYVNRKGNDSDDD